MGNEFGRAPSKLGITSIAATTPNIERNEFEKLFHLMINVTQGKEKPDQVNKEDFMGVLKQIDKFTPPDTELFVQLFTLFDHEGHDFVDYRSYISGSFVCLTTGPVYDRLKWGLSVFDSRNIAHALKSDVKKLLTAINQTAAYFGDPVLSDKDIDLLCVDMFKELPNFPGRGITHDDCIRYLMKHPFVLAFINGEGSVYFGAPELQI
jgi:Ca2+-binding EF-hand superfamily protein